LSVNYKDAFVSLISLVDLRTIGKCTLQGCNRMKQETRVDNSLVKKKNHSQIIRCYCQRKKITT